MSPMALAHTGGLTFTETYDDGFADDTVPVSATVNTDTPISIG